MKLSLLQWNYNPHTQSCTHAHKKTYMYSSICVRVCTWAFFIYFYISLFLYFLIWGLSPSLPFLRLTVLSQHYYIFGRLFNQLPAIDTL